jgi:hypothetical protein
LEIIILYLMSFIIVSTAVHVTFTDSNNCFLGMIHSYLLSVEEMCFSLGAISNQDVIVAVRSAVRAVGRLVRYSTAHVQCIQPSSHAAFRRGQTQVVNVLSLK